MAPTEKTNADYGSVLPSTQEAEPLKAVVMVEVTAPATLREGYKFIAVYEGKQFAVIVPAGGCTEGQTLVVPFDPNSNISPGAWKDDIFGCTRYGIFHPSLLGALCCPQILLGQIMTRLELDLLGNPAPDGEWKGTYQKMVYIFVLAAAFQIFFAPSPDESEDPSLTYSCFSFILWVFMIYAVMKVRNYIRMRDRIPEEQCVGCEDLVCAVCCQCCTISQMARQSTDYDIEDAFFFTNDGLSKPLAPVIVV